MRDIEGLKQRITTLETIERHGIDMKKQGSDWVGLCPFHEEKTPSFSVYVKKGVDKFHCHGCGAQGDQIDFVRDFHGFSDDKEGFGLAADKLAELVNYDLTLTDTAKNRIKKERPPEPEEIWLTTPAQQPWLARQGETVEVYNPKKNNTYTVRFAAAYEYFHADGTIAGVILRTETNGKKQFQTITYRTNTQTGVMGWVVLAMDAPRPLLGAHELASNPNANVLIVEGEKARLAAQRLIGSPKLIVITWAGGSKAVDKTDWSLLKGRNVIGWPDADCQKHKRGKYEGEFIAYHEQGGMAAMLKIASISGAKMKIVRVPAEGAVANGWDLADVEAEGWTRKQVVEFIGNYRCEPEELIPNKQDDQPPPIDDADLYASVDTDIMPDDYLPDYSPAPEPENLGDGGKYNDGVIKILGWDGGVGYYMAGRFKQLVQLAASSHSKLQLLQLAPLAYWMANFSDDTKRGGPSINWDMAADSLMGRAQSKGVFDMKSIRGRGAWFDSGRSVVHAGSELIVDGEPKSLDRIESQFIYQLAQPLDIKLGEPLQNSESVKFAKICEMIRWDDPISSRLLAGWCFLAPICGAIDWRPHLWLTGPAGSGKTTVLKRIMRASLGNMFIHAAGDTTEAGLRQRLRTDALPVLFDEFESEREKAAQKTQDVLSLVRQSSSDSGAEIIKGGANGKDDSYQIRSMFAFASISVNLGGQADESRVTVLSMKGATDADREDEEFQNHWVKFQKMINETMSEEYIHRLQARAIRMIPIIRQNIQSFSDAIAQSPKLGGRRLGDQVGTLLAGAYSLYSSKPIDLEGALKWIDQQDWSGVSNTDTDGDEKECLAYIMSHHIRTEGRMSTQTLTVAELIDIACGYEGGNDNIDHLIAEKTLPRYGLKIIRKEGVHCLVVSSNHKKLEEILRGSGYAGWGRILQRMDGAEKTKAVRFAGGVVSRGVSIPVENIRGIEEE